MILDNMEDRRYELIVLGHKLTPMPLNRAASASEASALAVVVRNLNNLDVKEAAKNSP